MLLTSELKQQSTCSDSLRSARRCPWQRYWRMVWWSTTAVTHTHNAPSVISFIGQCTAELTQTTFHSGFFYLRGGGHVTGTPALRPSRGCLAHCTVPMHLCECFRWWVGECAAWWPQFTRQVSGAEGGEVLSGFVQYQLDWPCQTVHPL